MLPPPGQPMILIFFIIINCLIDGGNLEHNFHFFYVFRIRNCLAQLYAKDITPDDKQELDEALQREVLPFYPIYEYRFICILVKVENHQV